MAKESTRTKAQQKLVALLEAGKITATGLARELGKSQPSVSAWALGQARPEHHLREALERKLGIKATDWMTDAEYQVAFGRERRAA